MKRLRDCIDGGKLGRFETIALQELRSRPGEVMQMVALGKTFLVTKNNNPIAVISRPPGETLAIVVHENGRFEYEPCGESNVNVKPTPQGGQEGKKP